MVEKVTLVLCRDAAVSGGVGYRHSTQLARDHVIVPSKERTHSRYGALARKSILSFPERHAHVIVVQLAIMYSHLNNGLTRNNGYIVEYLRQSF